MKIAVFNDTRTGSKHIGCSVVMANLEELFKAADMEPVLYLAAGRDWRRHIERLPKRGYLDAVIVNGEGTLHHSADSDRADILADVAAFANEYLNVPAFLINSTLFRNTPELYKKLSEFDGIYVRDSFSRDELKKNGLDGVVVPDMTFAVQDVARNIADRKGVGATDSVYGNLSKEIKGAAKEFGWDYRSMAVPKWVEFQVRDVFRPFRLLGKIKRNVYERSVAQRTSFGTPEEFITWLKTKKLVITGRYHTVTLCLLTRTPFIALESNTPKISALLYDVFGTDRRIVSSIGDICTSNLSSYMKYEEDECKAINDFLLKSAEANMKMVMNIRATTQLARKGL